MMIEGGVKMKKVLLSLGLCVLLCGCGNKLTCTAESDGMKSKATFTMKGDTLTSLKEDSFCISD